MSAAIITERLLTADEYGLLDDDGRITELVRGQVIEMSPPKPKHGRICLRIGAILLEYVDGHQCGHVFSNDSGIITERDPDTVRGPDIAYFSYQRLPADADLEEYPLRPPELVFEVKSPSDTWPDITAKAVEYLHAGVDAVCIVDPDEQVVVLHTADHPPQTMTADQPFEFPKILPGFKVQVADLFS